MHLSQIYVHPLKSCRGNAVSEAVVEPMGLQFDRRWMVVDEQSSFITGRTDPKMVLIEVAAELHGASFSAPGMPPLRVDIDSLDGIQQVQIWRSRLGGRVGNDEADFWFSDYIGRNCRLVYVGDESTRRSNQDRTVPVAFADGYPVLLIGSASLDELNQRLGTPVTMRHFRPNLVIETSEPFIEDQWRQLQIGEVRFENLKPCARCIFTTVDPDTGLLHPQRQPLDTLNGYRRRDAGTMFGINLAVRSLGTVRLGESIVAA